MSAFTCVCITMKKIRTPNYPVEPRNGNLPIHYSIQFEYMRVEPGLRKPNLKLNIWANLGVPPTIPQNQNFNCIQPANMYFPHY